jgi:ABC-type nitrate/sulfonate/bicarbonate transport system substrate-binding protein
MSKQVDAVANTLTRGIEIDRALDQGGVRLIPGTSAYDIHGKEYASTPSGFREDFIKEHPDTVRKYVTAVETTRRLVWDVYIKDPQRVAKAYAEVAGEKGGNPELAKYYRPAKPGIYLTDDDVQWWLDVMEAEGQLKHGQIKASDVYTNEFSLAYKEIKNKGEIK